MSNKSNGSKFEKDLAEYLRDMGYWCHLVAGANHSNSQPCDLIASMNNEPVLIDCKTLENKNGIFPLSRVEENQRLCLKKWKQSGNSYYYLAIIWENNVYYVDLGLVNFKQKSIDLKEREPYIKEFYK